MAVIASLSTLSTAIFKGGRGLTGSGTGSLVAALNTIIAKVNEVITSGMIDLETLIVGVEGGGAYYGTTDSWLVIDGTNPPTVARIRMMDETTGLYREIYMSAGVVTVA